MSMTLPVLQSRYALDREIARGGMSVIYAARDLRLGGKTVAIKKMVLPEEAAASLALQFQKEAEILASLSHPGIVQVMDYLEEDGSQYLVMPLVEGLTFSEIVNKAAGYLPVSRVVAWIDQMCDVLCYLHGRTPPVLVRDLKPTNIMLDQWGHLKLIDFGLARLFAPGVRTRTSLKGVLTPGFAPVEQYSASTDPRSDIYALGATAYALLTRRIPTESVMRVTGTPLTRISTINPEVPESLEVVIGTMMEISRDQRYQTAVEARRALNEAVGDLLKIGASSLVDLQTAAPEASTDRGLNPEQLLDLVTRRPYGAPTIQTPAPLAARTKEVATPPPPSEKSAPPPPANGSALLVPPTRMMNRAAPPPAPIVEKPAMEIPPTRLASEVSLPTKPQVPDRPPASPAQPPADPVALAMDILPTRLVVPHRQVPASKLPEMIVPLTIRMPPLRVDRTPQEDHRLRLALYSVGTLEFLVGMILLITGAVAASEGMTFTNMGVPLAGGVVGCLGARYIYFAGKLQNVLEQSAGWLRLWILLNIVGTTFSWAGFHLIRLWAQSGTVWDVVWTPLGLLLIVLNVRMLSHTMSLFEKE